MNIHNNITFNDSTFLESEWIDCKLSNCQPWKNGANHEMPPCTAVIRSDDQFDDSCDSTYLVSHVSEGGSTVPKYCPSSEGSKSSCAAFRQLIQEWSCTIPNKTLKLVNMIKSGAHIGVAKRSVMVVSHMNRFAMVQPRFINGISSVQLSMDLISVEMMDNDTVSYVLLAEQNGRLFMCNKAVFQLTHSNSSWKRFVAKNIKSDDFCQLIDRTEIFHRSKSDTNSDCASSSLNAVIVSELTMPMDFSNKGSMIRFGYMTVSGTSRSKSQAITGIDNFTLSVKAGFDEEPKFNLCTMLEGQHKKVLDLSEQVVRSYKQQASDKEHIEDLRKKLKMLEECYNKLRQSQAKTSIAVPNTNVHLSTVESDEEQDDFIQVTIEKKTTETPTHEIASSFVSTESEENSVSEKVNSRDYGFPLEDVVTTECESDFVDMNEYDMTDLDADTDVVFPESDTSQSTYVPTELPSLRELVPHIDPVILEYSGSSPSSAEPNNSTPARIITPSKNKQVIETNRVPKYFREADDPEDDDWEIMENTTSKFTTDKIIHPKDEI